MVNSLLRYGTTLLLSDLQVLELVGHPSRTLGIYDLGRRRVPANRGTDFHISHRVRGLKEPAYPGFGKLRQRQQQQRPQPPPSKPRPPNEAP
ncbi:hypothetical protein EYF80_016962 [Liparis tanakae]|uniref:Uncharacterized protein n=1 Tax=Liparis tanakae TaxID=230148 RepID=A0A4Z2I503_9TELE|nr:hypothetical protein EYF80_016962 [Liparis tanakae]